MIDPSVIGPRIIEVQPGPPGSTSPLGGKSVSRGRRGTLRALAFLAMLGWAVAVGAGLQRIWAYKTTAGEASSAPRQWPGSDLVSPHPEKATLIMFVHPGCTCTQASLVELQAIAAQAKDDLAVWILLLDPRGLQGDWDSTAAREAVKRMSNAKLITDAGGVEAARFGASTSGHVVLYDTARRLRFAGGITGVRGHVGDNAGRRSVVGVLHGDEVELHEHPVLGCGLHDPDPQIP